MLEEFNLCDSSRSIVAGPSALQLCYNDVKDLSQFSLVGVDPAIVGVPSRMMFLSLVCKRISPPTGTSIPGLAYGVTVQT